ncbi:MAG TPA: ATP-binding protein [Candidatus Limnocylindrales bacterium]|nr:ATP-binding protein [Candidatus Limnocylindrales bacterium]
MFTRIFERLKSRIQLKLIVGTSILLILVMGISSYGILIVQQRILKKELEEEGKRFAITLGEHIVNALDPPDINYLRQVLRPILYEDNVRRVSVYNAEGMILSDGTEETSSQNPKLPNLPAGKTLSVPQQVAFRYTRDVLEITNPLFSKNRYVGSIQIEMSLKEVRTLTRRLTQALIIISTITLGVTLILTAWWSAKISRPLIQLVDKAARFSQGHLEERIEVEGTDEISLLASTFNVMAENLSKILEEKEIALQNARAFNQELKKAQTRLIKAERLSAIGLLTSGISHEINNPLGIILTTVGCILEELSPESPFYEDLKIVEGEALRCKKILRDLLNFASKRKTVREQVDLNKVIDEIITLASYEKRVKSIQIQKNFHPDLPPIFIDIAQIKQVCLNLILNAADAMQGEGHLVISTGLVEENGKKHVLIQFQDSGCGIPEEDLLRIFEPFFTTKDVGEGSGLGLSVSYQLVENHGGRIEVTSEVGKGTTFYVYLPLENSFTENSPT